MELLILLGTAAAVVVAHGPLARFVRRAARPDAGTVSRAWLARHSAPR